MIGDQFLHETFPTLMQLKTESTATRDQPFMYDYFNISSFMTNPVSMVRSKMARVSNALISGLNDAKKLPRIILVIMDADILEQINFINEGKSAIIGSCLDWLVNTLEKLIITKKEEFRQKCPVLYFPMNQKLSGSLSSTGKVLFLNPISVRLVSQTRFWRRFYRKGVITSS